MTGYAFSGAWYIEHAFAQRMERLLLPRIEQGKEPIPANWRQPVLDAKVTGRDRYLADYLRLENGVGVVPITGGMSREGEMCSYGNETIARMVSVLGRDDDTKAIVLKINSPGGTVDSTRMLADVVKASPKPVVAWTPFCASAAYFVASQATEIWMEDQSVSAVGSIGVLLVHVDASAQLEKDGYKVQIIRAEGSEEKALVNSIEPIPDAALAEIKGTLKTARNEFVGYVRRGRAGRITSNEVFTGKMYNISDALRLGLADRKGSLDQAISRALQLSK